MNLTLIVKLKCFINGHTWGKWEYIAANSCEEHRVCQYCQATDAQTDHTWSDAKQLENCQFYIVCKRCGTPNTFFDHDWIEEEYADPAAYNDGLNGYFRVTICSRCGSKK